MSYRRASPMRARPCRSIRCRSGWRTAISARAIRRRLRRCQSGTAARRVSRGCRAAPRPARRSLIPTNLTIGDKHMAKAYWVATYHSISDPDKLAAYAKLAGPAIQAAGGKFLARGNAAKAYESGVAQRVVIIEFDSVAQAVGTHDSAAYQAALKVFDNAAVRDLRIVEGV